MPKILLISYLLFILPASITATNTFIHGKIQNAEARAIHVKFLHNIFTNEYANLSFPIDKQGEFHAELEIEQPTIAYCNYQGTKFKVYVEPQKDIGVFFDGNDIEGSIQFFEKDKTQNNVTWRKFNKENKIDNTDGITIQPSLSLSENLYRNIKPLNHNDRFEHLHFKLKNESTYFIENIKSNNNTSSDFQNYLYSNLHYHNAALMLNFVDPDSLDHENFATFNAFFNKDRINSPNSLNHTMYSTFLDTYALSKTQRATAEEIDYHENVVTIYEIVKNDNTLERSMKDQILGRLIYHNLHPSKIDQVKPLYVDYLTITKNEWIKKEVDARFTLANKFATGSPAPDFELENNLGEKVKLSDFKGKKVYLLFWAKWCAYCKLEIKNSSANRTELKDNEVEFIFISMDKEKNTWLEHPITNEEKEIHLWGLGMQSKIKSDYGIVNLPMNFLIDENGNFIRNFPKSDADEFVEYIRGL